MTGEEPSPRVVCVECFEDSENPGATEGTWGWSPEEPWTLWLFVLNLLVKEVLTSNANSIF